MSWVEVDGAGGRWIKPGGWMELGGGRCTF